MLKLKKECFTCLHDGADLCDDCSNHNKWKGNLCLLCRYIREDCETDVLDEDYDDDECCYLDICDTCCDFDKFTEYKCYTCVHNTSRMITNYIYPSIVECKKRSKCIDYNNYSNSEPVLTLKYKLIK